jgi:hypothetical protein
MPRASHATTHATSIFSGFRPPTDASSAARTAPPIDDNSAAIDELAFLLATDHLSTLEKIAMLEQWRYDMLLLDVASGEGLAAGKEDGVLLQQITKALLLLARPQCAIERRRH